MYQLYQEEIDQAWPSSAKKMQRNSISGPKRQKNWRKKMLVEKRQFVENIRLF